MFLEVIATIISEMCFEVEERGVCRDRIQQCIESSLEEDGNIYKAIDKCSFGGER